jgi:pimeloyl-ACP methyl ester carboxylesterase
MILIFLARTWSGAVAALVLAGALAACSVPLRPDLARMYRVAAVSPDDTPVILIPGLFGSKLRNRTTGVEVWPGAWNRVLFDDYSDLELKFDPTTFEVKRDDLEAFDLAEVVLGKDFYGPIVDTLVNFGGYVRATPGIPAQEGERRYYLFPYDWRQDNVEQAKGLERLIAAIRKDYDDPELRVDIVAHSMGGLIARYYLRYGPVDVLDGTPSLITLYGTKRVRKLILLGTPNFGAVSALHGYLAGELIGLKRMRPEVLATMPSGYQLFPHPLANWLIDPTGNALPDELFDPATWKRYRWNVYDPAVEARVRAERSGGAAAHLAALQKYFEFRLERARRFAWMLSTPEPATPIRYVLFGGDCTLTPARIVVEDDGTGPRARLSPGDVRTKVSSDALEQAMLEPGDGRVTKPSLLARETIDPTAPQHEESFLPIAYFFFLCEEHDQLTGNINFQDNLLNVLLTRNLPWEEPTSRGMGGATRPKSAPADAGSPAK